MQENLFTNYLGKGFLKIYLQFYLKKYLQITLKKICTNLLTKNKYSDPILFTEKKRFFFIVFIENKTFTILFN